MRLNAFRFLFDSSLLLLVFFIHLGSLHILSLKVCLLFFLTTEISQSVNCLWTLHIVSPKTILFSPLPIQILILDLGLIQIHLVIKHAFTTQIS